MSCGKTPLSIKMITMETKDLGTYHVRVILDDDSGFIMEWRTHARFVDGGTRDISPLTATRIPPLYSSEEDLCDSVRYMFTDGNYGCSCNLRSFVGQAEGVADLEYPCNEDLKVKSLTLIRPDGTGLEIGL